MSKKHHKFLIVISIISMAFASAYAQTTSTTSKKDAVTAKKAAATSKKTAKKATSSKNSPVTAKKGTTAVKKAATTKTSSKKTKTSSTATKKTTTVSKKKKSSKKSQKQQVETTTAPTSPDPATTGAQTGATKNAVTAPGLPAPPPPPGFDHRHADWNAYLQKYVVLNGAISTFRYKAAQKDPMLINKYLKTMSGVSQKHYDAFDEKQKIAFLINAYNAFTVKLVLDNYPVASIKKIGGLFSSPWKLKFVRLFGKEMSLDDIEHENLRKKFKEPRIHFAVNCASIGCPPLRQEAYVAERLDEQLNEQARLFLQDNVRNQIDPLQKTLKLSKIFEWYKEDFNSNGMTTSKFVAPFITFDPNVRGLLESDQFAMSFTDYDWGLNDAKN